MTCIEFRKRQIHINSAGMFLGVAVIAAAMANIYLYASISGFRQDISQAHTQIARAEVKNAELKNELYLFLDAQSQESFLQSRGYVIEKKPHYSGMVNAVSVR